MNRPELIGLIEKLLADAKAGNVLISEWNTENDIRETTFDGPPGTFGPARTYEDTGKRKLTIKYERNRSTADV